MVVSGSPARNSSFPPDAFPLQETRVSTTMMKAVRRKMCVICLTLLLTDEDVDGGSVEVPAFANLVFKEASIGLLYVLREVGVEHK